MPTVDQQIQVLEDVAKLLTVSTHALDEAGLTRPFELLLIDEPFVGLDLSGRTALIELMAERHAAGAALLVATHDPAYVEQAERCIALRQGEDPALISRASPLAFTPVIAAAGALIIITSLVCLGFLVHRACRDDEAPRLAGLPGPAGTPPPTPHHR